MKLSDQVQELHEALAKSEARFRTIFENSPLSIQILSLEGKTLLVNRAYRDLWSVTDEILEEHILSGAYNILEDENLKASGQLAVIQRAFAGEAVTVPAFYYEPLKMGLPGRARWTAGMVFPLKDKDGKFTEVAVIHQDVTDHYDIIAERERLFDEAQEAIKRRDEFLSIASHELRTPISSLSLQVEVLANIISEIHTPEADHARKVMGYTKRQVERLTRLVDDMMDTSGMREGRFTFDSRDTDLVELTRTVLDRFTDQLENMKIKLNFSSAGPMVIFCDPNRMDQVITNLMTNAIRYGNLRPITVSISGTEAQCFLKVSDQGRGISKEDQEKIFNRFERGSSAGDVAGLGLGLFINRQIVEQHGGSISVESQLGKGTTFTIELPRKNLAVAQDV